MGGEIMFLPEESKKIIVNNLINELDLEFIYLFGSFAKGEARDDSDIDIAIYPNKQISPYELFLLSNKLSLKLKKSVDLIDLNDISTVFAAHIVNDAEILYCKDDLKRRIYAMKVFKEYSKLNEERKVILDTIREEGSIYGK